MTLKGNTAILETALGLNRVSDHILICFSHLRWDFVLQRPQHLMTFFARYNQVFFWEEAVEVRDEETPYLALRVDATGTVGIATPHIPQGLSSDEGHLAIRDLLDTLIAEDNGQLLLWYYTPLMLPFSRHIEADCIIYDCMDELANFRFAPPELTPLETELFARADLVFTGGQSLFEAKKTRHPRVYCFPSSVDIAHFARARAPGPAPDDQIGLPSPRIGFYGVIDERMDLGLLAAVADAKPNWALVLLGPLAKISENELPRRANIHYLGNKDYYQLPHYLRGWDVAIMPFAINDATRYISPTKTPEYLAAGKPVVSTPIVDVSRHYGELEAVTIATTVEEFVTACEEAFLLPENGPWLKAADNMLSTMAWDKTGRHMWDLITERLQRGHSRLPVVSPAGLATGADYDVMVIGAGFAGSVMAERLATQAGKRVLVVDRRDHIAGNAYDRLDDAGILIHQYGPHIFHTNSADIVEYLSQFTDWRPYEHRVLAQVGDKQLPIPINRTTLNCLYDLDLASEGEVKAYLSNLAEPVAPIATSEDVVVAAVGRELYEMFFRGYTRKQWGLDPSELDKSVTARVPTRTNTDDRYFTDTFQAMPADGYRAMFERMLDHPNIDVLLGTDYREARVAYPHNHLVFTGPIDEYFDYRFGKLPYRSLRFEHETLDQKWVQPVATVNFPDETVPYTRITEYKHLTGQENPRTSITREYPCAAGDPYYPIPRAENFELYKKYEDLAKSVGDVTFVGRLATYRYYNMDQIVGQALSVFRKRLNPSPQFHLPLSPTDSSLQPAPAL